MSRCSNASVELPIHHSSQIVKPIGSTTTRPRNERAAEFAEHGSLLWTAHDSGPAGDARSAMIRAGGPQQPQTKEKAMTVAKVSEITSTSTKSFEDAVERGIKRASKTLKNVTSAWIADQEVEIEKGKVTGYRVRMRVTFVLED